MLSLLLLIAIAIAASDLSECADSVAVMCPLRQPWCLDKMQLEEECRFYMMKHPLCMTDQQKYCNSSSHHHMLACLSDHIKQLEPECATFMFNEMKIRSPQHPGILLWDPRSYSALQEELDTIPWNLWQKYVMRDSRGADCLPDKFIHKYLSIIEPYLSIPPAVPAKVTEIPKREIPDCAKPPDTIKQWAKRQARAKPARMFDVFNFAYELDVLEIRLFQLAGIVDYFGLQESTHTHRATRKGLLFAGSEWRFEQFHDQIIYLVGDYSDWGNIGRHDGDDWRIEHRQRGVAITEFIKALPYPVQPDDLFIHGDLDEIPDADTMWYIKHCQMQDDNIHPHGFYFSLRFDWHPWEREADVMFRIFRFDQTELRDGLYFPPHGGIQPHGMIVHMTYFGGPLVNAYKVLALAEGGAIPRNDMRLLNNITLMIETIDGGQRLCCTDNYIHGKPPTWLPWYVTANPERWQERLRFQ